MKGLYIVRFYFRNGTSERMQIRAFSAEDADRIARPEFREKYHISDINERGGVDHIEINQCDINSERIRKYL